MGMIAWVVLGVLALGVWVLAGVGAVALMRGADLRDAGEHARLLSRPEPLDGLDAVWADVQAVLR